MKVNQIIARAGLALLAVSFVASFGHVRTSVAEHGQTGVMAVLIALMPEISVALTMLKIRYGGMSKGQFTWTALVGISALAFTVWGNLAQAEPTLPGYVVAAWPAWTALGALGMVEMDSIRKTVDETGIPASPDSRPIEIPAGTTTEIPVSSESKTTPVPTWTHLQIPTETAIETAVRRAQTTRAEMIERLRHELPEHPERTTDDWAGAYGISRSTMGSYLKAARELRPVKQEATR